MSGAVGSSLGLLQTQRSHVLFVMSNAKAGDEANFLQWYLGPYRQIVLRLAGVLNIQHYEQHDVDITQGRYARLSFRYLSLCELSVDGAQAAESLIERITALHREQGAAQPPATWLYFPVSEKVGRAPLELPSMLTLAFANGVVGHEAEFREWYATRHIRHALNIPALVSGQCLERTQFQRPGSLQPSFQIIALYEQEGTPESIIQSFMTLPEDTFNFPTMDMVRFAEWVYRPL